MQLKTHKFKLRLFLSLALASALFMCSSGVNAEEFDPDPTGDPNRDKHGILDDVLEGISRDIRGRDPDKKDEDDRERAGLADDGDDDKDDGDSSDNRRAKLRKRWTSDFEDTDFGKHDFRDFHRDGDSADSDQDDHKDDERKKELLESTADSGHDWSFRDDDPAADSDDDTMDALARAAGDLSPDEIRRRKDDRDERREMKDLTKEIPGMLHDWVPGKVDRLHNGGFTKAADNGFPVPYRLNGHLDIQRKLPWEAEP